MSERLKADLALGFCSLIWGATFVVVKEALDQASVFAFLAVRFTLAAALVAVMFRASLRGPWLRGMNAATLRAGAVLGVFLFAGYVFQTAGLERTTPSKAAFITGLYVILVPLLLALFWRRRVNAWVWGGAVAAVVGLYYLTVPAGGGAGDSAFSGLLTGINRGDLLVLGCTVAFALHIIYVGRYTPHHSVGALTFLQVAATAVLAMVAVPLLSVAGVETPRFTWSWQMAFALAVTAFGATALAFALQLWAQRHTSATHAAILFSLEPVFAGVTSYLVLGERLGARGLMGAALILLGILLAELKGPAPVAPDSSHPSK